MGSLSLVPSLLLASGTLLVFLPRLTKRDSTDLELSRPSTEESPCLPFLDTLLPPPVSVFHLVLTRSRLDLPSSTLAQPLVLLSPSSPLVPSSLDLLPQGGARGLLHQHLP